MADKHLFGMEFEEAKYGFDFLFSPDIILVTK
jgi:hypothetical protein